VFAEALPVWLWRPERAFAEAAWVPRALRLLVVPMVSVLVRRALPQSFAPQVFAATLPVWRLPEWAFAEAAWVPRKRTLLVVPMVSAPVRRA
jgi:hypothetical protein